MGERRFGRRTRATLLAGGYYQRHDGSVLPIRAMADRHLINALLVALREDEPGPLTTPLAREVRRRGLEAAATEACRQLAHA